ncbi:unnamed protein product [Arctogadus glacialis]
MLDGDDSQEPLSRVPRPDRLDFLRITPPEDDIVGDTPYYPNLDCTVDDRSQEDYTWKCFQQRLSCLTAIGTPVDVTYFDPKERLPVLFFFLRHYWRLLCMQER